MQSMSAIQSGKAQQDAAEYNIEMGEIQARDVLDQTNREKEQLALIYGQEEAQGLSEFAASGTRLGVGSSLDWQNDLSETLVSDNAALDEGAARTITGIRNQQNLDKAQGDSAVDASYLRAGGSLLSGAGKAANMWYTPKTNLDLTKKSTGLGYANKNNPTSWR